MVPGLGATHLWRLLKAQPGQRPLAVLNNLSTYMSVLSCCLSLHQPYERGLVTSADAVELKMHNVRNRLCYILVDRCSVDWAWLPYLSWLLKYFVLLNAEIGTNLTKQCLIVKYVFENSDGSWNTALKKTQQTLGHVIYLVGKKVQVFLASS